MVRNARSESAVTGDNVVMLERPQAAGIFERLNNRKNPYVKPAADAARNDLRNRLPAKYAHQARTILSEASGYPEHNFCTLAAALAYADAGLHVIDSHALDASGVGTGPSGQVKIPRGSKWQARASVDPSTVTTFWTGEGEYPADKNGGVYAYAPPSAFRNVSIAFPPDCGLFVIDIDGEPGKAALAVLEAKYGELPQTWESITGSGGYHLIFQANGADIRNTASCIAPGVDIRGANGQIIAPPSIHPEGEFYRWDDGCAPWECEVADAPEWLVKLSFEATKGRGEKATSTKGRKAKKGAKSGASARQGANRDAMGFDAHLDTIGDGDGQRGFDGPIYSAACSYFSANGTDADGDELFDILRATIAAAEMKDDRSNKERYLSDDDYLTDRIEQAREFISERQTETDDEPFDITAPLGSTLPEALTSLDRGFRYVNIGGEGRFIRHLVPGEPPKLEVWNTTALANWYANQKVPVSVFGKDGEEAGEEDINPVPVFFNQAQRWDGTAFAPYPAEIGKNTYNLFRGFTVEPKPGDCALLKDFMREIICDGDENDFKWLWHWMAHLVQRPGEKPKTALVIWGEGGIGKGTFGHLLRALVRPYGTTFGDADAVVGRWSGQRHAMNLVGVSEEAVFSGDRRVANALKHKVDHEECDVEVKNIQPITMPSFTRYVFDSNHPDAINIEGNGSERRYFVRRVSNRRKGDIAYFRNLRAEIAGDAINALFHELASYDPADAGMEWSDVFMAPETQDRKVMERETMRPVYRVFAQMVEDGEFLFQEGLEKYRFDLNEGQTLIPKRMLQEFVSRHGDSRQAAETDPSRVFERLFGQPLSSRRARSKCYYRRANEDDADTWVTLEQNVQCYDLRVVPLMLPPPDKG